jgi:hypothetical protein
MNRRGLKWLSRAEADGPFGRQRGRGEGPCGLIQNKQTNKQTRDGDARVHRPSAAAFRLRAVSSDSGLVVSRGRPAVPCRSLISLCFVTEVFGRRPVGAQVSCPHMTYIYIYRYRYRHTPTRTRTDIHIHIRSAGAGFVLLSAVLLSDTTSQPPAAAPHPHPKALPNTPSALPHLCTGCS